MDIAIVTLPSTLLAKSHEPLSTAKNPQLRACGKTCRAMEASLHDFGNCNVWGLRFDIAFILKAWG